MCFSPAPENSVIKKFIFMIFFSFHNFLSSVVSVLISFYFLIYIHFEVYRVFINCIISLFIIKNKEFNKINKNNDRMIFINET